MACPKCNQELADSSSFCPACGKRLVAREWTISGFVVGLIATGLLLLGAGGTWLVIAKHKAPPLPIPPPTAQVIPDAMKPSPQIAADATQPSEIFKDFAPAKASSSVNPAAQTPPPHTSEHQDFPLKDARSAHAFTDSLGPVQEKIAARTQITRGFTLPDNIAGANFQADVVRLNGSQRLHVWVVGDNRKILFDSGVCTASHINLDLKKGNYVLIVVNNAILMPITVDIRGILTGKRP